VNEESPTDKSQLHPYGLHRLILEELVSQQFDRTRIVRLPGLVGIGLRKNILFDIKSGKDLGWAPINSQYQFYPVNRLREDLQAIQKSEYGLFHLAPEPLSLIEISTAAGIEAANFAKPSPEAACYDFRTDKASVWGGSGPYMLGKDQSMYEIKRYLT